jgi:hypothetical protein
LVSRLTFLHGELYTVSPKDKIEFVALIIVRTYFESREELDEEILFKDFS